MVSSLVWKIVICNILSSISHFQFHHYVRRCYCYHNLETSTKRRTLLTVVLPLIVDALVNLRRTKHLANAKINAVSCRYNAANFLQLYLIEPLTCGDRVHSVQLVQYHGCWCLGSLRRQFTLKILARKGLISRHPIVAHEGQVCDVCWEFQVG